MYKRVKVGGLAAELMNYFLNIRARTVNGKRVARTLTDFLDDCGGFYQGEQYRDLGFTIRGYCQKLINADILFSVGFNDEQEPPYNERFFSYDFDEELAAYGSYEFAAFGFLKVREHFRDSVRPVFVKAEGLDETNGTCFLIGNNRLVTAAHCLEEGTLVSIGGWNPSDASLESIRVFPGEPDIVPPYRLRPNKIDLAILQFEKDPFPAAPKFGFWTAEVLDEVLCMGFPPMRGFHSVLVAGTGQVIGEEESPQHKQPYIIFSARVKGGNSGGPVVNSLGKVVGVVTNMLSESMDVPDALGYGLATPARTVFELIQDCDAGSGDLDELPFKVEGDGIRMMARR